MIATIDEREYFYLAGFMDGEGHIGIKKEAPRGRAKLPTYTERVSVAGTNKQSIELFHHLWPGHLYYHKPGKNSKAGYWSWEVTGKKAREFLGDIKPYLRIKGLDAEVVLALGRNKAKTNGREISVEDRSLRNDLYKVLKAKRRILWEV